MTRILVVDDEPQILRALRINLRVRKYDVDVAADGAAALASAASHHPDLVVLDLGLPDMDGVDVICGLRGWSGVPIIVLSGRAGSQDKVAALDAGADDYITKPFGVDELLARIRAITRRLTPGGEDFASRWGAAGRTCSMWISGLPRVQGRFLAVTPEQRSATWLLDRTGAVAEVARVTGCPLFAPSRRPKSVAEEPTNRPANEGQAPSTSPPPAAPRLRVGPWLDADPDAADAPVKTKPAKAESIRRVATTGVQPSPPVASAPGVSPQAHASLPPDAASQPIEPAVGSTRRILHCARDYGWLLAAGAVALAVLLCSIPVLSNAGATWKPGDVAPTAGLPLAAPSEPLAMTSGISPSPTWLPSSPNPSPMESRSRAKPAPPVPATPVLLGPASQSALKDMLTAYCRDKYGDSRTDAELRSGTDPAMNNWQCQIPKVRDDPLIDLTAACAWKFSGPGVFATFTDPHNAYSWRCYRR